MTEPRIQPLQPPYAAEADAAFTRVMPPGMPPLKLFRTMAHSPRVLQRMFAGSLLDPGPLSLRQRELVILRTTARCKSGYEWGVHVALFGQRVKLTPEEFAASAGARDAHAWSPQEAVLLEAVDQLHDSASLDDAVWARLAQALSNEQILELIALTGYYHTISFLTNALAVAPEEFAPTFPPQPVPQQSAAG